MRLLAGPEHAWFSRHPMVETAPRLHTWVQTEQTDADASVRLLVSRHPMVETAPRLHRWVRTEQTDADASVPSQRACTEPARFALASV